MNEQPAASGRTEDDAPGSPKRKKVRSKYAPKACVSCRRSKLKCSGENPCQRCLDNGRRCFYSEDQTAAEALQNLSRPTPVQPPPPPTTNGNGAHRRSILPRYDGIPERRASDASVIGISMEARMARIEGMMEALIQERDTAVTPRGSMEREDAVSDSLQIDPALGTPMEPYTANPTLARQQLGFLQDPPELQSRHSISAASPSTNAEPNYVRIGLKNLEFPSPIDYQKYVDFFFADVNPCRPCVNEAEFRIRSEQMLSSSAIHATDIGFLALNYIIFACVDILVDITTPGTGGRPPGWHWFHSADELVGKRKISGRGGLNLVQFLVLEAVYLTCADMPNAAYNEIGIACRLCYQLGLHQQSGWINCTPFAMHMRQRIFWTVYYTDRQIALSCGRPYGLRDDVVDVQPPPWISDESLHPDQPLPQEDVSKSFNVVLTSMMWWARLAGDVWDQVLAPGARRGAETESTALLDTRIKHCTETTLPTISLLPPDQAPDLRHLRQHVLVYTRFNHLRLLLRRQTMLSLNYDGLIGRLCGDLALDTVNRLRGHTQDTKAPSSFRFHMAVSLGSSIVILATLLLRDLDSIGIQDQLPLYRQSFEDAIGMLQELSVYLQVARRVSDDLKAIVHVVTSILNQWRVGPVDWEHTVPSNIHDLFPYRSLDFAQQAGGSSGPWNEVDAVTTGTGADFWEFESRTSNGYGVPWL